MVPALWPLLVVAGLFLVPVECVRIGHPHSIFQPTSAVAAADPALDHADGTLHAASDHHAEAGASPTRTVPGWARPVGDMADLATASHGVVTLPVESPAVDLTRAAPVARAPGAPILGNDLPRVEPAVVAAVVAFGTALALLLGALLLRFPGRCRVGVRCVQLRDLLDRALDPPPPRAVGLAC